MEIGVISDTHGIFSDEFRKFFEPVDEIWHAGDFGGGINFVHQFSAFKPLVGVYGNCDAQEIRFECPKVQLFNCEGKKVLMTHIGGHPGHYERSFREIIEKRHPDIVITGHSHILQIQYDKTYNHLFINPGAAGLQGWQVLRTAVRFKIEDGKISDLEILKQPKNF